MQKGEAVMSKIKFTKMHGIGNDYVYVNCLKETVPDPAAAARYVSDRHFGIGSDGLILICPSDEADFEMKMYNADGSQGAMCGNGIRCVAKYVYDYGLTDQTEITVATGSGVKHLDLTVKNGKVELVRVDMGAPILQPEQIPVKVDAMTEKSDPVAAFVQTMKQQSGSMDAPENGWIVSRPLVVKENVYEATCVSMGNPHCIVCVDDVDGLDIEAVGPDFENHPCFPDRVNTEFIRVFDRKTVQMRVWERGSGETWACGTGACAVAVACILNGWADEEVTVKLRGGDLQIFWDRKKNTVFMTGPATTVFDGEIEI